MACNPEEAYKTSGMWEGIPAHAEEGWMADCGLQYSIYNETRCNGNVVVDTALKYALVMGNVN